MFINYEGKVVCSIRFLFHLPFTISVHNFCSSGFLDNYLFQLLINLTRLHKSISPSLSHGQLSLSLFCFFVFNKVIYYLSFKNQLLYLRVFLNLSILRVNPYSSSKPGKVFQEFMRANTHTWTVRWLKAAPSELYFSPITITSSTTTTATTTATTTNKTITTTLTTTTTTTTTTKATFHL